MINALRALAMLSLATTLGCSTPPAMPVNKHTASPKPAVSVEVKVGDNKVDVDVPKDK